MPVFEKNIQWNYYDLEHLIILKLYKTANAPPKARELFIFHSAPYKYVDMHYCN